MRSIRIPACLWMLGLAAGCAQGGDEPPAQMASCSACTSPDTPECRGCLGSPEDLIAPTPYSASSPFQDPSVTNQITITMDTLSFAVVGDTRPAIVDDTAGYPTGIITKIFQDLEAASPRPGFTVATGDYQFSSSNGTQAGPQLDLYLQARAAFSNAEYPAMGNHECTGYTASNCGPGTTDGATGTYNTYLQKVLNPIGISNPYYSVLVQPTNKAWSAKFVFIAANAWTSTQSSWLTSVMSQPTTYTFVVRHESSLATTAPGVSPS